MMRLKHTIKRAASNSHGFTLVEVMITLAIVGMMMSAVYAVHISSIRAVDVEEERVEMQQDQRIAIDFLSRELRMAGYDKLDTLTPTIEDARSNYIYFTTDVNADGDVDDAGEHVAFCIFDSPTDGIALSYITGAANTVGQVGSAVGGGALAVAHTHTVAHQHEVLAYAEAIEFLYTLSDDTQTTSPTEPQMEEIRSVTISLLSRANDPDPRWNDTQVYVPASGTAFNGGNPYNDTTRRRLMTANVRFRNMGLN